MPGLEFAFEWAAAESVRAPELRATWARLEVWVGSDCASYVEDRQSGSARRSVYGALYPLAEWIAYNWWFLQAHTRPAGFSKENWRYSTRLRAGGPQSRWLDHHNLRAAGDGQAWPNLTVLPQGDSVRLAWFADESAPPHVPVRFMATGDAVVALAEVRDACARLVESVLTRLDEVGVNGTRLAEEWAAIMSIPAAEQEFCIAAARLGLDPYALDDEVADLIVHAGERLDPSLHEDFYSAVSPANLTGGTRWVLRADHQVAVATGPPAEGLQALRADTHGFASPVAPPRPWKQGWVQARDVRRRVGLAASDRMPVEDYVRTRQLRAVDPRLQALGGLSDAAGPVLVTDTGGAKARRRFLEARALWHLVHRPHERRFLIVAAQTDRHRVERAFAAELLAPAEGVAGHLDDGGDPVTEEQLDDLGRRFGVSPTVIRHQVENQLGRPTINAY